MKNFLNPYLSTENPVRINTDIDPFDKLLIQSVLPGRGFLQTCQALFIRQIANECRRNKLTYTDSDTVRRYILRCTTLPLTREDYIDNDSGGVKKTRAGTKGTKNVKSTRSVKQTSDSRVENSNYGKEELS